MRCLCLCACLWLTISCRQKTMNAQSLLPAHSKPVVVKLTDSLGTVSLYIPKRYDTSYSWIYESDCKICGFFQYRFQPHSYEKEHESWGPRPFILYDRLTIRHSKDLTYAKGDTSSIRMIHNNQKEIIRLQGQQNNVTIDSLCEINGRYFALMATTIKLQNQGKNLYIKTIEAVTTVKGIGLEFKYEILVPVNDSIYQHFIPNSLALLQTIHIEKGY